MKLLKLVKDLDWYDFDDLAVDQYWNLRLSLRENDFVNPVLDTIWERL